MNEKEEKFQGQGEVQTDEGMARDEEILKGRAGEIKPKAPKDPITKPATQVDPPKLFSPSFLSTNERIVCQPISKDMDISDGGIWLPKNKTFDDTQRERDITTNKWYEYWLFIVGLPARIDEIMPLPSVKDPTTKKMNHYKVQVGDIVVISDMFEPIERSEGDITFLHIHFLDILGIIKTPKGKLKFK